MKPPGAGEARAVFFGEKKQGEESMNPQMTQMAIGFKVEGKARHTKPFHADKVR
ncbi:MAG TPA: hypothetical protein VD811_02375 [Desulfuromonadales bacterium]|nr:hypothetical protein [Desulfuromonadales bacterium]